MKSQTQRRRKNKKSQGSKGKGYAQKSKTKFEILGEISLNVCLEIKTFKKIFSIVYYMNSLTNEHCKTINEGYNDNLISDILNKSTSDTEYLYICLEDQFDYCFRKNVTI